MHLENLNPNKRNSKVTCRGTTYWIGHGGFIAEPDDPHTPVDIPEEHASVLLQGKAWRELAWDPNDPKYAKRMMPAPEGKGLGRRPRTRDELHWEQGVQPKTVDELEGQPITVATKDGKPTGTELIEKPMTDADLEKAAREADKAIAAANAKELEEDTGLMADVDSSEEADEAGKALAVDAEPDEWLVPDEGEEWPDPTEDMPIDYLRQMAVAYAVTHTKKTAKKTLIKNITKEMYDEE